MKNIDIRRVKTSVTTPRKDTAKLRDAHSYEEPAIDIVPLMEEESL